MTPEAKTLPGCQRPARGEFTYEDCYGMLYTFSWTTLANGDFDITLVTKFPHVWGEPDQAKFVGNVLWRRGIVTTERQILRPAPDGYLIVAEGASQNIDFFQSTFPCGPKPADPACYHFNNAVADSVDLVVSDGSHFTDPSDPDDNLVVWPEINLDGTVCIVFPQQAFRWVDVWREDDTLVDPTCQGIVPPIAPGDLIDSQNNLLLDSKGNQLLATR